MTDGPVYFRFTTSDGGTLRLDLNLDTGWKLARGLDLGIATVEKLWLSQPPYDGALMAASWRPPVRMRIPLLMTKQTSAANMKTLIDALVTELDRDTNTIRYRPQGYSTDYLIDTYRADIPSMLKGDWAPSPFKLMQTTTILVLEIDRAPQMRSAGSYV